MEALSDADINGHTTNGDGTGNVPTTEDQGSDTPAHSLPSSSKGDDVVQQGVEEINDRRGLFEDSMDPTLHRDHVQAGRVSAAS